MIVHSIPYILPYSSSGKVKPTPKSPVGEEPDDEAQDEKRIQKERLQDAESEYEESINEYCIPLNTLVYRPKNSELPEKIRDVIQSVYKLWIDENKKKNCESEFTDAAMEYEEVSIYPNFVLCSNH